MKRATSFLAFLAIVVAACGGESADTTTAPEPEPTTTAAPAPTTTQPAPTTTAAPEPTTTAAPAATVVPSTPVVGLLAPYNDGGAALFPGPIEAHWYQWGGLYVVLYRGWDAADGTEICAGNSILPPSGPPWIHVTNSVHLGSADEICIDTAKIAEAPSGVYACGSLLYYLTEIPVEEEGSLFGTLEVGLGGGVWNGHTSEAPADLANTPEFEPGLTAYEIPASGVDDGGVVTCG